MKALTNHRVVGMEVSMRGIIREAARRGTGRAAEGFPLIAVLVFLHEHGLMVQNRDEGLSCAAGAAFPRGSWAAVAGRQQTDARVFA
jgi:hypothetical protein